jgi:hypothetical protein
VREVTARTGPRGYVGSLGLRIRKDMPLHTAQWGLTKHGVGAHLRLLPALASLVQRSHEDGIGARLKRIGDVICYTSSIDDTSKQRR